MPMSQAMSVRARARSYDDVLRLLDHQVAAARRRHERAGKVRGRANNFGNPYGAGNAPSYQVWAGRTTKNVSINFPVPNEYYDYGAITVLRTAYELYKADDLTSDLIAHFRKQVDAAPTPADALFPRLALSYLNWWEDDKDAAVAEFSKVADSSSAESDLRLALADLQEKRGEPAEALVLVDAFSPQDNAGMRRREEQAMRLAITTGNLERARQAAERLFGLRLDTDTQVWLAGQMHQLGQHELAEAVLGRARSRAGNKATALVALMLQYQRQDKVDAAVQAALQILQSTTAMHMSNPNVYNPNSTDAARSSAIQVLARSGRIQGIIDRAEEQLKRTPNAIQLHQALADYYKAAGLRDKARAELIKVAELRPDDAALRLQVGTQLLQEGQSEAALAHFKAAFKKDPSVTMRSFYQIENAFRQAGKTDELIELLEQMDLRKLGRSYLHHEHRAEHDERRIEARSRHEAVPPRLGRLPPGTLQHDRLRPSQRVLGDAGDVRLRHPVAHPRRGVVLALSAVVRLPADHLLLRRRQGQHHGLAPARPGRGAEQARGALRPGRGRTQAIPGVEGRPGAPGAHRLPLRPV